MIQNKNGLDDDEIENALNKVFQVKDGLENIYNDPYRPYKEHYINDLTTKWDLKLYNNEINLPNNFYTSKMKKLEFESFLINPILNIDLRIYIKGIFNHNDYKYERFTKSNILLSKINQFNHQVILLITADNKVNRIEMFYIINYLVSECRINYSAQIEDKENNIILCLENIKYLANLLDKEVATDVGTLIGNVPKEAIVKYHCLNYS